MLDGAIFFVKGDADLLARAPEFEQYVLEHLVVSTGGTRCPGRVEPPEHLVAEGVLVRFACDADATEAKIAVSMLTDLDPAYRTEATGPAGQAFTYSSDRDSHDWELPAPCGEAVWGSDLGVWAVPGISVGAAAILAAIAAAYVFNALKNLEKREIDVR